MEQNNRLEELIKQADKLLDFPEVKYEAVQSLGQCSECSQKVYSGEDHLLDDTSPVHVNCAEVREFKDMGLFDADQHDDCDDDYCGTHGMGE